MGKGPLDTDHPMGDQNLKENEQTKMRTDRELDSIRNESVSDINIDNTGIYVIGKIEQIQMAMLVDTGSSVSILSSELVKNSSLIDKLDLKPSNVYLTAANINTRQYHRKTHSKNKNVKCIR